MLQILCTTDCSYRLCCFYASLLKMNFIVVFEGMTSYHACTLLQQCIQFAVEVTVTHVPHIDKLIHYIITL